MAMENEPAILNGRYKLIRRAGAGGMSTVYKAQDLSLGRLVAVKMLHETLTGDAEFLRRFQQEAHAAANLSHPNIVTVHDIGQDGHLYYIVMEYVEGKTLKELIRQQVETTGRPLPINRALELVVQICAGVGYAHRAGLVHCDVKPQNVVVTRDDRIKVTDFGIARALSQTFSGDDTVWGTPQYFSPEQAAGQAATPASDVYSIGIILFELLTGRLPFEGENPAALAIKHLHEAPPPVTRYNPAVPQQLERIIGKVLSKEPAGRYRTAEQLGRILTAYQQSSREETGPVSSTRRNPAGAAEGEVAGRNVAERETLFYQQQTPPRGQRREEINPEPVTVHIPAPAREGTDWTAVSLGILALLSLLGLIPLWYVVYLRFTG